MESKITHADTPIPSKYNHIKIVVVCCQAFMRRGYKLLLFVFCSVFIEAYLPTENLHMTNNKLQNIV